MKSKLLLPLSVAALAFAAGCGSNSWPANMEANFLKACEVNGKRSGCECALSSLKGKMTADQFAAAETAVAQGSGLDSRVTDAIASCKK